jgi:hypothetical protein
MKLQLVGKRCEPTVCHIQYESCMSKLKMLKSASLMETATLRVDILATGTRFERKPSNSKQCLCNNQIPIRLLVSPFQLVLIFFFLNSAP